MNKECAVDYKRTRACREYPLSVQKLEKLDDRNRLYQVVRELQKHFPLEKLASLNMFYRSFNMTHCFLPEIWDRLLEDAQLDKEYWSIYVRLYDPALEEERTPTPEEAQILKRYRAHWHRLNLDVEDWFLHAHILMEKFARLAKELIFLTSVEAETAKRVKNLPTKSFHKHLKFFLRSDNQKTVDIEYAKILKESAAWYSKDLKDIRDDLIQHETPARFWSYSISPKLKVSRVRHSEKLVQALFKLRDKYAETYVVLKDEKNFFALLSFFETHIDKLEVSDSERVKQIRRNFGRAFPNIPTLYSKINSFFSLVNDHFMLKSRKCFQQHT